MPISSFSPIFGKLSKAKMRGGSRRKDATEIYISTVTIHAMPMGKIDYLRYAWIAPIPVAIASILYDVFFTDTNMYQYIASSAVAQHLVGVCIALALSVSFLGLYGLSLEWRIGGKTELHGLTEISKTLDSHPPPIKTTDVSEQHI